MRSLQTIYIDILLCINLVINFLLLSAAAFYLHEDVTLIRLIAGAAFGALCSLEILLPVMPLPIDTAAKLLIGAATVFAAFGRRGLPTFAKLCAIFLAATFFFGGLMAAVWFLFTPRSLVIKNSVVYLNISPLMLILLSAVCYGAFRLFFVISGRYKPHDTFCTLTLGRGDRFVTVKAKIDTGNSLCEPFSQCPVIVIGRACAESITPPEIAEYETVTTLQYRTEISGVRFVPFSSVGGRGILPCFKAEKIFIDDLPCTKSVYIALCDDGDITGDFSALVPCEII